MFEYLIDLVHAMSKRFLPSLDYEEPRPTPALENEKVPSYHPPEIPGTKVYLDFGPDSFLMAGSYVIDQPSSLSSLATEMNANDHTSATITIHGPLFQGQVKERLRSMVVACEASGTALALSVEVTDDCEINEGREIMGDLLGIAKDCVSVVNLAVPDHPLSADGPTVLDINAPSEMPSLHSFSWKGDIRYLPSPWHSLSNLPFSQFTDFTLECDTSINDRTEMLYRCDNAVSFRVHSRGTSNSVMKPSFKDFVGRIFINRLEVLAVSCQADYAPLVDKFRFASLTHTNLPMYKPRLPQGIALEGATPQGCASELSSFKLQQLTMNFQAGAVRAY
jgi:hypothetical protein